MTTAKIAALSKTDGTGITEDLAERLWPKLGTGLVAIVEFFVAEHSEAAGGEKGVKLVIGSVEPATGKAEIEHLQSLRQAFYRKRNPQPTLTDLNEPTVAEIVDDFVGNIQDMIDGSDGIDSVTISSADGAATIRGR